MSVHLYLSIVISKALKHIFKISDLTIDNSTTKYKKNKDRYGHESIGKYE